MSRLKCLMATFAVILISAFYLKRIFGPYSIVVPLLFMFLDVSYGLRVVWLLLKHVTRLVKGIQYVDAFETTELLFYVLPSDLDLNFHMNNSRYLRECDFGRYNHWIITGIWKELSKLKCGFTLGASTIRYRRSLELGNRVCLQSKIIYWDEKAFYVEQRLINADNFVCAIVIAKQSVISPKGQDSVTPQLILETLFRKPVLPLESPPELESWLKYNIASSDRLKLEQNKFHYQ